MNDIESMVLKSAFSFLNTIDDSGEVMKCPGMFVLEYLKLKSNREEFYLNEKYDGEHLMKASKKIFDYYSIN